MNTQIKTPQELMNDPMGGMELFIGGDADCVSYLLARATLAIDQQFGDGYAKANPSLVGAYIQSVTTLQASTGAGTVEEVGDKISGAILELAEVLKATISE